jgi:hypothetical protein
MSAIADLVITRLAVSPAGKTGSFKILTEPDECHSRALPGAFFVSADNKTVLLIHSAFRLIVSTAKTRQTGIITHQIFTGINLGVGLLTGHENTWNIKTETATQNPAEAKKTNRSAISE